MVSYMHCTIFIFVETRTCRLVSVHAYFLNSSSFGPSLCLMDLLGGSPSALLFLCPLSPAWSTPPTDMGEPCRFLALRKSLSSSSTLLLSKKNNNKMSIHYSSISNTIQRKQFKKHCISFNKHCTCTSYINFCLNNTCKIHCVY